MGVEDLEEGLVPRMLLLVVENLRTDAMRAEQAAACTKEREKETDAGVVVLLC